MARDDRARSATGSTSTTPTSPTPTSTSSRSGGRSPSLAKRGLLNEGYKIQPYCARCGTTLSSHEVAQNYKDAEDPSIWTLFHARPGQTLTTAGGRRAGRSGTTSSWWPGPRRPGPRSPTSASPSIPTCSTRSSSIPGKPGDLHPARRGSRHARAAGRSRRRASAARSTCGTPPAIARFRGRDLEGLLYDRLFTFFEPDVPGRVVLGDYVTSTDGTGLVHTAPPFGEDDYQTGRRYGLPMILSVDGEGKIVAGAGAFAGLWFKDADPKIIQDLKSRGLMLHRDRYRHSYPFCWRCDRPLLYYATTSWFIRTTEKKDELVAQNTDDRLAPRAHRRGAVRQLAGERGGLGPVAPPLLGDPAADLALRRVRAPAGDRLLRGAVRSIGPAEAGGPLRSGAVQSPPALHRRDRLALREVRDGDHAAGGGGDRRLVRLGRHALRPAPLSVREPGADRRRACSSPPTSSPRPWIRPAAGSTPSTSSACCSSIRWPTRPASCSATSTTSRGGRCRSAWATSSSRWR